VLLWGVGEGMLAPTIEILTSKVAVANNRAGYFGFLGLAGGIGGIVGNVSGGLMFHRLDSAWFWTVFTLPTTLVAILGRCRHDSYVHR
jgi:MFS family permease